MRTSSQEYLKHETKQQPSSIYSSQRKSEIHKNFNYIKFCQAVLDKINLVRVSPYLYIKELEFYQQSLDFDNILRLKKSGEENYKIINLEEEIYIQEGKELFEELIHELKRQCKREPLKINKSLVATAEDFMLKLQMHDGSDNKLLIKNVEDFVKRIGKYGVPHGLLAECVDYSSTTPDQLVLKLLLDDGDKARIDRSILLNTNLNFVGISSGMLPTTQNFITVIDFCEHFYNFNDKIPSCLGTTAAKVEVHSKKKSSVLDYLHKEKNFAENKNRICRVNGLENERHRVGKTLKKADYAIKAHGEYPTGLKPGYAMDLAQISNKLENSVIGIGGGNSLRLGTTAINLHKNNHQNDITHINCETEVSNRQKLKNCNLYNILSKLNPDKLLLQGKLMNKVQSQSRLKSYENGRNISKSINNKEMEDESMSSGVNNKNNPQNDLSRSIMNNGSFYKLEDKAKKTYHSDMGSTTQNNNFKLMCNNENILQNNDDINIQFNFDDFVRKIEIENNEHIKCINTNKKIIIENRVEKYLVKRKIYYKDGSIDEWCYKEEK